MKEEEWYENPDEEDVQPKTGRSAYWAGVFSGDGFSGSYRGVKPAPHGGAASVKPEDTIGSLDDCWCGLPNGHDWPGKDRGAKHPRGEVVSAQAQRQDRFDRSQMRKFDRRVTDMVAMLHDQYGVRVRMQDGTHALLYPPDGTRPFRIAEERPAEQQLAYLEKFAAQHVAPHVTEVKVEDLVERFNDPTKKAHPKSKDPDSEPVPVEVAEVAVETEATDSIDDPSNLPPEGWHQYRSDKTGEPLNWWESDDGERWMCQICGHVTTEKLGIGGHGRAHSGRAKSSAVRQGRSQHVQSLLRKLAIACDVDLNVTSDAQAKKIAKLEERLAAVTAERDEYKARLDLIREGLRA